MGSAKLSPSAGRGEISVTRYPSPLIDFIMCLLKGAKRKVHFILDNWRGHNPKPFNEWLEQHEKIIDIFYLPSYSPELNPDEYLNCHLKGGIHSGKHARSKKQLTQKASKHIQMLQRKPIRVRKYFNHEKIRYAA